jgi:hypothetical protein
MCKKYIVRLDAGYFSARVDERRSATYAMCWSDGFHFEPDNKAADADSVTPKRIPGGVWITHSEKDTSSPPDHSERATSNAPKRKPTDHSEKDTIETKQLNEKQKQQEVAAELLRKEGFDAKTATELARRFKLETIRQQIQWLASRNVTKSRVGLLRRAIEGDWPPPGKDSRTSELRPSEPQGSLPPEYLAWLREQNQAYRKEAPSDYERFLAKRERRRSDIRQERSDLIRKQLLEWHDCEARYLTDFQKFFTLPSAQHWDETINQTSNQPQP